jgi:hypothetical protein
VLVHLAAVSVVSFLSDGCTENGTTSHADNRSYIRTTPAAGDAADSRT